MGKTKTAVISEMPDEKLTGKAAYEQKRKKQDAKKAAKAKLTKKGKGAVTGVGLKGGERIKVVGGDIPPDEAGPDESALTKDARKASGPRLRGKKYKASLSKVNRNRFYSLNDAIKLVKDTSFSKFDGTVELHLTVIKQGLSVKAVLPHSAGKTKKIEVADEKTLKKLKEGKIDFDVLLATADMMPKLVPFAKTLGPKGLMPNPKNGTIIKSAADAKKFSVDSITLKTERKVPIMHVVIGKVSQKESELKENVEAIITAITPRQVSKAVLTSTMGPGIKLKI